MAGSGHFPGLRHDRRWRPLLLGKRTVAARVKARRQAHTAPTFGAPRRRRYTLNPRLPYDARLGKRKGRDMPKIDLLPSDDSANGWSRILPQRTPKPSLAGEVRADWVVVGAGFAGLAAARRLAENRPNDRIALIEAQEVGEGASGRNSGFAIDLPHNIGGSMEELDGSRRFMGLARAAIAYLEKQIADHAIACDWSRRGKYLAAVSDKGVAQVLEPFARELEALGEPYRWVEKDDLAGEIGTPFSRARSTRRAAR